MSASRTLLRKMGLGKGRARLAPKTPSRRIIHEHMIGRTEYSLHATKGWRSRYLPQ